MNRPLSLDEIIPHGTIVHARARTGESDWALGDALKQGGMGIVYEVTETHAPFRRGVLKTPRPDRDFSRDAFDREAGRLEARLAGEHGPRFYGRGTFGGRPFIIMQFAGPIRDNLGIREALDFADDVADGLSTLQENRFCHGDVKPHNLGMIDGRPALLDFGSIRPLVPETAAEEITRTPGYAAPELEENGGAAPWVDNYGLATTLNAQLSPAALDAYSTVLRAAMDLRPEVRIESPAVFKAAMHARYKEYRRQRLRAVLIRAATHLLAVFGGIVLCLIAVNKRQFRDRTAEVCFAEASAMTELRLGRYAFDRNDRADAITHFSNAVRIGKRAERILQLLKAAEP